MSILLMSIAKRVPKELRTVILEEGFIDSAVNRETPGTPMEYLFDVYEEFVDKIGEHGDWNCHRCREEILIQWRKLKPYLENLKMINQ